MGTLWRCWPGNDAGFAVSIPGGAGGAGLLGGIKDGLVLILFQDFKVFRT